jgi:hypothetical protein
VNVDFIISNRLNTFASGVGRFNELLAEHLGTRVLPLFGATLPERGRPLLSFKVSELDGAERAALERLLDQVDWAYHVFLHDWTGTALERRLVADAEAVYCGNHEILEQVGGPDENVALGWSPGLILDTREFPRTEISVFSFGMAHKLSGDMLTELRDLLQGSGRSWSIYVSGANHETASIGDAQTVFEEVSRFFPTGLYFLGNLSDVAVSNYLRSSTFFAAFFDGGVRANNGTVRAAMDHGAVVITNLDAHSPPEYVHMHNVIDIGQCARLPVDPDVLAAIAANARATAAERSFDALIEHLGAAEATAREG